MPRGDGTGPNGQGAMTGRGIGFCAGSNSPGFMNGGFGRGRGFGRRRGFGCRAMPLQQQVITEEQEKQFLEQEVISLKQEMKEVEERLKKLK